MPLPGESSKKSKFGNGTIWKWFLFRALLFCRFKTAYGTILFVWHGGPALYYKGKGTARTQHMEHNLTQRKPRAEPKVVIVFSRHAPLPKRKSLFINWTNYPDFPYFALYYKCFLLPSQEYYEKIGRRLSKNNFLFLKKFPPAFIAISLFF